MRIDVAMTHPIPQLPAHGERSHSCSLQLRHVLNEALKRSAHNRTTIAALMSELTGERITKAQIDAWTSESKSAWRFPFEYAAAFEAACGARCTDLQALLCSLRGTAVLTGRDVLYAELGRITELEEQTLKVRKQEIRQLLRENNN